MYTTGGERTFIATGLLLAIVGYTLFALSMIFLIYIGMKENYAEVISAIIFCVKNYVVFSLGRINKM